MSLIRSIALILVLAAAVSAYIFVPGAEDLAGFEDARDAMVKRDFQHIWRNLPISHSSMLGAPRQTGIKRNIESLSRDRANAFYRLG